MLKSKFLSQNVLTLFAFLLGLSCGFFNSPFIISIAEVVSEISIKLMKLVALPLLFLSVVSSAAHFTNFNQIKTLGKKILKYTLATTFIAAFVAEVLYWVFAPYVLSASPPPQTGPELGQPANILNTILQMIPNNVVEMFLENNVIAVVIVAIILGLAILALKERERDAVFLVFVGLLNASMSIVRVGLKIIPFSVWAFVTILAAKVVSNQTESLNALGGLAITVIAANLIQGFVILPALLAWKGINAKTLFIHVKEALFLGFFTRSSMATLPVTLERAIDNAKISPDVARLSLPLCTTINMNGCAQFILLSVYFVSAFTGNPLSPWEHVGMIFLAVISAVGNAGVPMGCFFLASSIMASNDIPLHLMGSILPLYTIIDMVETSLNIWSDVSITKIVDEESK